MANAMNLGEIWEWNPITGNPFTPADDLPNQRYCPSVDEMADVANSRIVVSNDLKHGLWEFMTSNHTQMTTYLNARESAINRGYLRLIRSLDFKKIRLTYVTSGKLNMLKLHRDTPFNGQPYGITSNMRISLEASVYRLVEDINHNAMIGWLGPGTFPCCDSRCDLCNFVGRSPIVDLGPHGQLELTKRAYCRTRNAVYVGTCLQCEQEETFTCYFGESEQQLNNRCAHHYGNPCNSASVLRDGDRFPTIDHQRAEVARVIADGVDNEEVLRDWFSHVTDRGVHPGHQRISVVDIFQHPFLRKTKERSLVAENMFHNGDFHYLGRGRGCLNTYIRN